MVFGPTAQFWQERYEREDMLWDRGGPSPQLGAWLGAGVLKAGHRVVVPGCGVGYEAASLSAAGLKVTALDYAQAAVERTEARVKEANVAAQVIKADVLQWQPDEPFDRIYEQTCLCALHPDHWRRYTDRLHDWLKDEGLLCAVFMQAPRPGAGEGQIIGPPYHCDIHAMRALFPQERWQWPRPPYEAVPHPNGWYELAVVLKKTAASASR